MAYWGDEATDIYKDIREAFSKIKNTRWVCKNCGTSTFYRPSRFPTIEELRLNHRIISVGLPCPNCCSIEWEFRDDKPADVAE